MVAKSDGIISGSRGVVVGRRMNEAVGAFVAVVLERGTDL